MGWGKIIPLTHRDLQPGGGENLEDTARINGRGDGLVPSAVLDEAENRLHIQKAIPLWCFHALAMD